MSLSVPLSSTGLALSVAIVVPSFDRGGLEQVALNLYRGYRQRGCRCIVLIERNVAGYMLDLLEDPSHGVVLNGEESLFVEALARHGVDVLHYHYSTFGLPEARQLGIYTLYTLHNVYTWLDGPGFGEHAHRVLQADRVVAVSTFVRDYFRARTHCTLERIDVVENGIDLDWLGADCAVAPVNRAARTRTRFAMPASYFPVKHQVLAVRAVELLSEERDDLELVLLGNVGEEAYAAHLRDRIARSPAAERISERAYLPREEMAAFYRDEVDVVLLPTLQEGCSNVVLEALALDLQMILTDVGNAREAAAMSPRVRLIERTEAVDRLTPERIAKTSVSEETENLDALVSAMRDAIDSPVEPATIERLAERRKRLGVDRMVDAYHRMFVSAAPLAACPFVPAWAKESKTEATFA